MIATLRNCACSVLGQHLVNDDGEVSELGCIIEMISNIANVVNVLRLSVNTETRETIQYK